jgi:hypothetical protein
MRRVGAYLSNHQDCKGKLLVWRSSLVVSMCSGKRRHGTRAISFYQHLGAEGKQKVRFFFAGDALETFLE